MIKNALKNWKTTSAGLTLGCGALIHLVFCIKAGTATETVWTVTCGAVIGAIGLIAAGDAGQSQGLDDALGRIDALEKQVQNKP
jgi:peptidoglycan/LPS O-acetylase OafA/YrhL